MEQNKNKLGDNCRQPSASIAKTWPLPTNGAKHPVTGSPLISEPNIAQGPGGRLNQNPAMLIARNCTHSDRKKAFWNLRMVSLCHRPLRELDASSFWKTYLPTAPIAFRSVCLGLSGSEPTRPSLWKQHSFDCSLRSLDYPPLLSWHSGMCWDGKLLQTPPSCGSNIGLWCHCHNGWSQSRAMLLCNPWNSALGSTTVWNRVSNMQKSNP